MYIAFGARPLFRFSNLPAARLPLNSSISHSPYLFQAPYPVSPLLVALAKIAGVWGYSFHFGKVRAVIAARSRFCSSVFFTWLRTLLHLQKSQLLSLQGIPQSLPKTTRVGVPLSPPLRHICYSGKPKMRASHPLPPQNATRKRTPTP